MMIWDCALYFHKYASSNNTINRLYCSWLNIINHWVNYYFHQQKVDISSWLTYQYGKTFFPLHTNNRNGTLLQSEYKLYILVEADLKSYNPIAATHATKVLYLFILLIFSILNVIILYEGNMILVVYCLKNEENKHIIWKFVSIEMNINRHDILWSDYLTKLM